MRTCERLVKEGRFTPSNPVGILTSGYYELLQNKVPLLGEDTQLHSQRIHDETLGGGVSHASVSTAILKEINYIAAQWVRLRVVALHSGSFNIILDVISACSLTGCRTCKSHRWVQNCSSTLFLSVQLLVIVNWSIAVEWCNTCEVTNLISAYFVIPAHVSWYSGMVKVSPHLRAPKDRDSNWNRHRRRVNAVSKACASQTCDRGHISSETWYLWPTSSADAGYNPAPLSRCLLHGLLLFWEALTRSVFRRHFSRLLWLSTTRPTVLGTSVVPDPWVCFESHTLFSLRDSQRPQIA